MLGKWAIYLKLSAVHSIWIVVYNPRVILSGDVLINSVAESVLSAFVGIGSEGGIRGGNTPHATMTEAAEKTTKEMPSIIDKHMNDLLNRHKVRRSL